MSSLYNPRTILGLIGIRFLLLTSIWIIARNSYVFDISIELRSDVFGTRSFGIGLTITIIKILIIFLVEILFSSNFTENEIEYNENTWKRIVSANLLLIISELLLLLLLLFELQNLISINFVRSIITTASLFSILMNPSGYVFLFWIMVVFYISGMLAYMYSKHDDPAKRTLEFTAFILFFRSIILPI